MEDITNIKFAMSKTVPMFALKWDAFPNATRYKILFSNGKKPEFTEKPLYRIPGDVDVTRVTPYIQAFHGDKKLTRKTPVNYNTSNILLLG